MSAKAFTPSIETQEPTSFLNRPVRIEFKELFKAVSKGVLHYATGKVAEAAADAVDALSAIGLNTKP